MSAMEVVELASVLARRYYGPKSGAVVHALLQYPRSTVTELTAPASAALLAHHRRMLSVSDAAAPPPPLTRDDVCRSLAALIQAGVVLVVGVVSLREVAAGEGGGGRGPGVRGAMAGGAAKRRRAGGLPPPPPTHRYMVDTAPLILRLRHPFFVRLTQDQIGMPAAAVMGALLARGRATASSLLMGVVSSGGVADVKEGEEALAALVASKYVRVVEVGFGGRPAAGNGGGAGGGNGVAGWPGGGGAAGTGGGSPGGSSGGGGGSGSGGSVDGGPEPTASNDRTVWSADMGYMQRLLLEDLCAFVAFGRLGADASRLIRAAMRRTLRYPPSRDGSGATPSVPVADVLAAVAETVPTQTALALLATMARPEHRYVELGSSGVGEAAGGGGGVGPSIGRTVAVRHGAMVRAVQASTVEFYVKKRWGTAAYRIYRLLTSVGVGSLEQKDIGDAVLMPLAPARELLYRLLLDGLVRVTEVAKTTEHKSSAAYHLWAADGTEGVARVLGASIKAATNYLLRVEVLERCLDRVRREVHDDDSATSAEVEALQRRIDALDVTLLRLDKEIMVLRDLGDDP